MKSPERERPATWDENWRLLRKLWPDWKPTDEQIREVWFRSFDKKHGVKGADRLNQDALREGILAVARSKRFRDPAFLDISDAYRHEANRVLSEIDRSRLGSVSVNEQVQIEDEERRNRDAIEQWPADRMLAARETLEQNVASFRGKSSDPATWSRVYVGFLIAADAEARKAGDGCDT